MENESLTKKTLKIVALAASYCILFVAWNVTQVLTTSVYSTIGFLSLAIVYFVFSFGCLIIPLLIERIGLRASLILGTTGYACYTLASSFGKTWLIIIASFAVGLGAAFIWISQGIYLSIVAEGTNKRGYFSGIFFMIFQLNGVFGNLTTAFLLKSFSVPVTTVLWVMTVVGFVGSVCISATAIFSGVKLKPAQGEKKSIIQQAKKSMLSILYLLKEENMRYLILYMIYAGTSFTFTVGIFPNLLEINTIPIVFVLYGVIQCIGSIVWGKIYDRTGGKVHLLFIVTFTTIGYILVALSIQIVSKTNPTLANYMIYTFGITQALSDSASTNFLTATLMGLYTENPTAAFSVYRLVTSLMTALGFFYGKFIPYLAMEAIVLVLLTIATIGVLRMPFYRKKEKEFLPLEKDNSHPVVELESASSEIHVNEEDSTKS